MPQATPSLFGIDPALVEQALLASQQAQALEQSKMSPTQLPVYQSALAGQQLGQVVKEAGGALGGQDLRDPRLIKAEKIKAVMAKIRDNKADITKPADYYTMMAKEFENAGLTEESLAIIEKASKMGMDSEKHQADIAKLRADAQAKLREKMSTIGVLQQERAQHVNAGRLDLANEIDTQINKLNTGEYKEVTTGVPGSPDLKRTAIYDVKNDSIVRKFDPYNVKTSDVRLSAGYQTFDKDIEFRKNFLAETKDYDKVLAKVDTALLHSKEAISNPATAKAFQNSLADLMSPEGQRAVSEIAAWAKLGNLPQRLFPSVNSFLSGTYSASITEDIVKTLAQVKHAAASSRKEIEKQYADRARKGGIDADFITGGVGAVRSTGVEPASTGAAGDKKTIKLKDGREIEVTFEGQSQ